MARTKKEKPDPICEACRERMKGNVPAHACEWCREEQQQKGRRAWVTDIKLGSVLLGDMNEIGQRVPDESVDVICTDPPYIQGLYEKAYANLAELAYRVLKPYGFLFTYVPNEHLDEIMDLMRFSTGGAIHVRLKYFWTIQSLNGGQVVKNHHHNALCMHKQILIFQKVQEDGKIRGARRCFADVVRGFKQKRYHPWQQSVHDLISFLDRFMQPGEILLDPYAGTGTSLIAGQLLGMEVVGFEIDPNTHAIAVREMQQKPLALIEEDLTPDAERDPAPEPKDTSRQAAIEGPAKEARPVEIKAACLRCKVRETCTTHAPYVNCKKIEAGKADTSKQLPEAIPPSNEAKEGPTPQDLLDAALFTKENATPLQPTRQDPDHGPQPISTACRECERFEQCTSHDPHAGCLDAVMAIKKAVEWKEPKQDNFMDAVHKAAQKRPADAGTGGGPQPIQEGTCGTCGHHKGRKTFHESCPRLGELLFKGGTKSAKVLMEETQRDRCEHWIPKAGPPSTSIYPATEPHYNSCPEACPYKGKRGDRHADAFCKFNGILLLAMKECPCHVLGNSAWEFQIRELKGAIKRRLDEERPSQDNCQCFTCPDGVMRCGIGDDCCPINKVPFGKSTSCPQWEIPSQYFTKNTAPKKKTPAKKPKSLPYGIKIMYTPKDSTLFKEMGRKYSLDITGPNCGSASSYKTREDLLKAAQGTLEFWSKSKPAKIVKSAVKFDDRTGEFDQSDFFDQTDGTLKPVAEPKKKTSRKKKEEPQS